MTRAARGALWGSLRYEALMAARRKVLWVAVVPLVSVALVVGATSPAISSAHDATGEVGAWMVFTNAIATFGVGVALADRFARTRRRGIADLLDATPASVRLRMVGTLAGGLCATLAPFVVATLFIGGVVAIEHHDPAVVAWALGGFIAVILPAALAVATLAATVGLVLPVAVVRVAVVAGWFWATLFNPHIIPLPSITGTVASPLGDYAAHALLGAPVIWAGRGIGVLSPAPTPAAAALNVAILLVVTACSFLAAGALRARRH